MFKKLHFVLGLSVCMGSLLLAGCGENASTTLQDDLDKNRGSSAVKARFSPATGKIPSAIDLLRSPTDGTLNIPIADTDSTGSVAVKNAINSLDGFSTIAPILVPFTGAISTANLTSETVRIYDITDIINRTSQVPVRWSPGNYLLSPSTGTANELSIVPIRPFRGNRTYMVILTTGITDSVGNAIEADLIYDILRNADSASSLPSNLQRLAPWSDRIKSFERIAGALGISGPNIALSWSFKTQSIGHVLQAVRKSLRASDPPDITMELHTTLSNGLSNRLPNNIPRLNVYTGYMSVPYYLQRPTNQTDNIIERTFWVGPNNGNLTARTPTPTRRVDVQIPVLMSVPVISTPTDGFRTVIYQHGFQSDRSSMLALAPTMGAAGLAMIGIDLPLHGITTTTVTATGPFNPILRTTYERTFDIDLKIGSGLNSESGSDGAVDDSGAHIIQLGSLRTSRDHLRQASADLMALTYALEGIDFIDHQNIRFMGVSLGGIVGGTFIANESSVSASVLNVMGGGIAKLLAGSTRLGPQIAQGLRDRSGINAGTAAFESFFASTQWVIDDADPLSYIREVTGNRSLLIQEYIGDKVVPNNVLASTSYQILSSRFNLNGGSGSLPPSFGVKESPSSGTDPYAFNIPLVVVDSTTTSSDDQHLWTRFSTGNHSIVFDLDEHPAGVEMRGQAASFLFSNGSTLTVGNSGVLLSP